MNLQQTESIKPIWDGKSCLYITGHAARRLENKFNLSTLGQTPFSLFAHYCLANNELKTAVWAIPIGNGALTGYILGRWEHAFPQLAQGNYDYWFVGVDCVTDAHFRQMHLKISKSTRVNVVRVMNQLVYWRNNGEDKDSKLNIDK